ncbi:histidine kinase [Sabulilitoribacter arenilitoris]|uniref:Histidine kinase n=1 Tax=Wocania arenilitoris TaxID=2044858 RepID=A0AAE3ESW3_9FLAO|nr:histidine kinase [Wocania arenilitoris]MCF7569535.1 histidine kinase [Wocania arenilitoris]
MKSTFTIFKNKIKTTIPLKYHVVFWVSYFIFNVIRWGSYNNDFIYSLKSNLIEFPIHIILVYLNIYYFIPKFILKDKYIAFILSLVTALITSYFLRLGLNFIFVSNEIWISMYSTMPNQSMFNHFISEFIGQIYVIAFASAIKIIVEWSIEKKRNEKLSQLQLSTELKFLRTQVQPHFFFNTLNNLYALALNKSNSLPRLILKLSNMMEYVLYDVTDSKADLLEEISHINNYIDIENLRFKDKIDTELHITGDLEDVKVPPLLLITFVENCFKHGLKGNDKIIIKMNFEIINKKYLEFKISNNFNPLAINNEKKGIGISNSLRRLKLLFAKDFILQPSINNDIYSIFLKIPVR